MKIEVKEIGTGISIYNKVLTKIIQEIPIQIETKLYKEESKQRREFC